ncbi:hypothetical protein ZIOFF_006039 [Zingiber officinale]|uniref:Reverse transcriptase RNase H-like domain-containing protein n=1 Tax=Zingiber officinale TaxID=94328 RepID=A0A8J5IB28_ZINOF|nr:hypothetical protein ZIOFF_006039 [Zingiber officinale]
MKIGSPTIEFLGATIGQSTIKLQPHVISKIADFKEQELSTTKGLRSWLGLLNYAKSYIPNLGRLLGPLYAKTSPTGEKKMNFQDLELIRKIKKIIKELPDLSIPPNDYFIIIEADGCMESWGGICKWKPKKYDFNSAEKICAYSSGKYNPLKSTIDAEIHAVMNSLNSFKIYYLDKTELIIRTDCQAIISFFNKSAQNKPSRVKWLAFTGLGIETQFQHVNGKDNLLADALSRLVCSLTGSWTPAAKDLLILAQIEEALLQIKDKPNLMASQHLAGLMSSFNNMKNWPAIREEQVSTTKKNPANALTWPTSSGQQLNTSLAQH